MITGATGSLAGKLIPHFRALGWRLRLTDRHPRASGDVIAADLSRRWKDWAGLMDGIDTVIHLAAASSPWISWDTAVRDNIDATSNVMQAAIAAGVRRVVFASSNWVLAGYEDKTSFVLDSETPPHPTNAYGASKLFGERMGASVAANTQTSVVCLRIGWCTEGANLPCRSASLWAQRMWLSDQDLIAGFERAVTVEDGLRFATVNLVSDNHGMAWDLREAWRLLRYAPASVSVPAIPAHRARAGSRARSGLRKVQSLVRDARTRAAAAPPGAGLAVSVAVRGAALFGQGPLWHAEEARWYWADLLGSAIHWYAPASGHASMPVDVPVSAVAATASGGLIATARAGVKRVLPQQQTETLATLEGHRLNNRLNHGKCDRAGRLWVGSIPVDGLPRQSCLYRIGPDGDAACMDSGFSQCGGLGWSPDDRTMYLADTGSARIYAYDFDRTSGQIGHRRVLVHTPDQGGSPAGLAVDADGCVWSAMWDGWCVNRYDPAGVLITSAVLPVPRPTGCAFGGPALDQLYVTTARAGLSWPGLRLWPLSGSILAIDGGVRGCPVGVFGRDTAR